MIYLYMKPSWSVRYRFPNNDFHVTPECCQQTQETLHGILTKVPSQEARNIRLGQTEQFRCLDLLESSLTNDLVNASDELCL